jgi:hypothetical protein
MNNHADLPTERIVASSIPIENSCACCSHLGIQGSSHSTTIIRATFYCR